MSFWATVGPRLSAISPSTTDSKLRRSPSSPQTNRIPMPASSPAALACTTSPLSSKGWARPGTVSRKRKRVPMGSGFLVLMKVPPLEMFLV